MPPPTLRGRSKNRPFGFLGNRINHVHPANHVILSTTFYENNKQKMISVAEAIQIVRQQTAPLSTERVRIEHALGRVLAEDVVADTDLPPFNRAQMDGYAV